MGQDGLLFFHCCGQSGHVATSWQTWSFALEVAVSGVGFLHLWQDCPKVSCIRLDFSFSMRTGYAGSIFGDAFAENVGWSARWGWPLALAVLAFNARRTVAKKEECIARSPVPKVAGSSTLQQRRLDFKPWQKILAMAMKRVTVEMQRDVHRNIWYIENRLTAVESSISSRYTAGGWRWHHWTHCWGLGEWSDSLDKGPFSFSSNIDSAEGVGDFCWEDGLVYF